MKPRHHDPVPLVPHGDRPMPAFFTRGTREPYAIRWFGSTALMGHLRHLGADALASENLDTRDWMRPQQPHELLAEVARTLRADGDGATLVERMGRPVWIDYVSDTGDDFDVSTAVARMVTSEYAMQDDSTRVLPRGDMLIFGGDLAYPLSSTKELARRLVQPWNGALRKRGPVDRPRALLGIPANHDWYDGLDGFARLFRRDPLQDRVDRLETSDAGHAIAGAASPEQRDVVEPTGSLYRQLHLDELVGSVGLARDALRSVTALLTGRKVKHITRLALVGYRAVQEASYWLLPLAPGLDLWGVDRQLRTIDFRQRLFFNERRLSGAAARRILVSPDPAMAMGERNEPGVRILQACQLSLKSDQVCYLTGDSHHYERSKVGASMHVIAGGGGAFVHGTRVHHYSRGGAPACAFPNAAASRRLAASVPLQLLAGTAGFLPHLSCAALATLQLGARQHSWAAGWMATAAIGLGSAFAMFQVVAKRRERPWATLALALAHAPVLALAPFGVSRLLSFLMPTLAGDIVTVAVQSLIGPLIVGHFLLALVVSGLEHHQAYAVLGHPGYKHFLRLCVHPDGKVEAWAIGKDDTLGKESPALIDHFEW